MVTSKTVWIQACNLSELMPFQAIIRDGIRNRCTAKQVTGFADSGMNASSGIYDGLGPDKPATPVIEQVPAEPSVLP
ncbi:MAG TPA: hypothetical protein VMW89_02950 [Desulfatiglandales bacterium]|nr:hypothetical protein [Desulfatiglandales bacterium]